MSEQYSDLQIEALQRLARAIKAAAMTMAEAASAALDSARLTTKPEEYPEGTKALVTTRSTATTVKVTEYAEMTPDGWRGLDGDEVVFGEWVLVSVEVIKRPDEVCVTPYSQGFEVSDTLRSSLAGGQLNIVAIHTDAYGFVTYDCKLTPPVDK